MSKIEQIFDLLVDKPLIGLHDSTFSFFSEGEIIRFVLLSDEFYELHKQSFKNYFYGSAEPLQSRDFHRECPAIIDIKHLNFLLELPAEEFIACCYRMFLMRDADEIGFDVQTTRLQSEGKFSVLQDLLRSEEFAGLSNFICISSEARESIMKGGYFR